MKGSIRVCDAPGGGSIFSFDIQVRPSSRKSFSSMQSSPIAGLRVLVGDPDPESGAQLKQALENWSLSVELVDRGERVLSSLKQAREHTPFHVVVFDEALTDMDGRDLATTIHNAPLGQPVYTVVITASGRKGGCCPLQADWGVWIFFQTGHPIGSLQLPGPYPNQCRPAGYG